ncbi:response regulator transcription factor [bacterium]|nr:response regulator transcription factor [bacterium]
MMQQSQASIIIVDDHPIVREGLKQIIQQDGRLTVCAEAENYQSALDLIEAHQPDIAIVDLSLKQSSGLDLIKEISSRWSRVKILVLSIYDEMLYAERAIRAGANGYVMKQQAMINILDGIHCVLRGETFVSEAVSKHLLSTLTMKRIDNNEDYIGNLSNRQLQIFQMYGQGMKTRAIAGELNISIKTVESHREHILEKLHLNDSSEMVRIAIEFMLKHQQ